MVLSIVIAAPVISLVLILFGAPASDKLGLTFLCAAHMALLTAVPAFYVHGLDWTKAKEVVAMLRPIDEVHGGLVGTLVGAWLGAVPIPLDW
jgi:phosphatidylinositol glycan class F